MTKVNNPTFESGSGPGAGTYDVVVIGASTAGLYAAQLLAEGGLRVALFERSKDLQPSRRTLIVTPAFGEVLDSGIPDAVTIHRSGIMRVSAGSAQSDVAFVRPDPVIERRAMTKRLLAAAVRSGVEILFGWRFVGIESESVRFENAREEELRVLPSKALIGADGVLTDVAPNAGIERPPSVPLVQAEIDLPSDWDPDVTKVWFRVAETPYFYWLIPESASKGVVGLIGTPRSPVRKQLDGFLKSLKLKSRSYQGAQVAMYHPRLKPWRRLGKLRVLLVGDAAGQVKVTTVGGTVTGLSGAAAAAKAILRDTEYRDELRPLKRELDVHWWMRKVLNRLRPIDYEHLVRMLEGPVGELLARHHRDEMARAAWRIPILEPNLLLLGLRAFFRESTGGE